MSSTTDYADFVVEQLATCGSVSTRRMFGEFALYVDTKVAGLICDDTVFIKVTAPGLAFLEAADIEPEYGKPYPGAKDYLVLSFLDQVDLATGLVNATMPAVPAPKPKKPRPKKG